MGSVNWNKFAREVAGGCGGGGLAGVGCAYGGRGGAPLSSLRRNTATRRFRNCEGLGIGHGMVTELITE